MYDMKIRDGEEEKVKPLKNLYNLKDSDEITTFLQEHSFLVPLLSEAPDKIETYFPDAKLILEMFSDPEGYGANQLVLFISTELNAKEARQKLKQLNSDWWIQVFSQANGQLSINIEFR